MMVLLIINDHYSYAISIVLCSLTLVVIVVLIVALVFGAIGFRTKTDPKDRTSLSNCGGIILLMSAINSVALYFKI